MAISPLQQNRINDVIDYVGTSTSDYLVVKRELINNFPPPLRTFFSMRHQYTKKHILNEFDIEVINYWEQQTGVLLRVDPSKLHDPDWVRKPSGWALMIFNQERKLRNEQRKRQEKP